MGGKDTANHSDTGQASIGTAIVITAAAMAAMMLGLIVANGTTPAPAAGKIPSTVVNDQGWTAPTAGTISSPYRPPGRPDHVGTDISNAAGTPIWAASAGKVTQAECTSTTCAEPRVGNGCGWTVRIEHGNGIETRYCHLREPPLTRTGEQLAGGQAIGYMGSTGDATGDHLHFECYTAGFTVDCQPFLAARGVTL